jgi:Flp pilus assembly pilin Flp
VVPIGQDKTTGGEHMLVKMQHLFGLLHENEEGQGLVEYLLILALVAFACTAGMNVLASGLNVAFSEVGSLVNAYIT